MWRVTIVFCLIGVWFVLILCRLFYWQVISYGKLATEASNQHYYKLTLPASRGEILSSDTTPLVLNQAAFLVYAEPKKIVDKKRFVRDVATILEQEEQVIEDRISVQDAMWVPIDRKVDKEKADKLMEKNLPGLGFEKIGKRFYPEASMAAQLLGFVASDESGEDKGYFGIEGKYDRELRGRSGFLVQEKDARGAPILLGEEERIAPEDGRNLVLWLDKTVQQIVQNNLRSGMEKYGAKEGAVVVMNPKNGALLALASEPSYDPRNFLQYPKEVYKNPVVAGAYEPGSTFKALIMAAALNEDVIKADTKFDESGPVQMADYVIRTWDSKYHGEITMSEVLQYSSNVGMLFVGQKLGQDKILKYISDFGFGALTNIDVEEEVTPSLRLANKWLPIDLATATFGQGIAVTPIQMTRAVGALANEGKLMEPRVVKKIIDPKGKTIDVKPKITRSVISKEAAQIITDMMVTAVSSGEAKWAKPKGYQVAGKTGTAQIPVAGHYDDEKTIASFIGFAPADNPAFVMLVTLREPSSSQWGSETAAPLFFAIAKELFVHLGIPPTE